MQAPSELRINAWTGDEAPAGRLGNVTAWAMNSSREPGRAGTLAADEIDLRDWSDPRVGWGVVLPDDPTVPAEQRHTAAGAPDCIQDLVAERSAPVFRYTPDLAGRFLARYRADGRRTAPLIEAVTERGSGPGQLPWYLLIVGGPDVVPWDVQLRLNLAAFTGRLPLTGEPLERYVAAMRSDWPDSAVRRDRPVFWATDHGHDDITWLMHRAIARPLADKYAGDAEVSAGPGMARLFAADASSDRLRNALAECTPALVVTASHGMTGPLDDPARMGEQLGLLVDQGHQAVRPADLLKRWQPDGAIWYAHACCSAGADGRSRFSGLVAPGSRVHEVLERVASLGPAVAPLPLALLGSTRPLRAFIGHVEPTFDWTLRHPENQQVLTGGIRHALYDGLFSRNPRTVGMAFWDNYQSVGSHLDEAFSQREALNIATKELEAAIVANMLRAQLIARDRQSMVILGDPAATLPRPQQG